MSSSSLYTHLSTHIVCEIFVPREYEVQYKKAKQQQQHRKILPANQIEIELGPCECLHGAYVACVFECMCKWLYPSSHRRNRVVRFKNPSIRWGLVSMTSLIAWIGLIKSYSKSCSGRFTIARIAYRLRYWMLRVLVYALVCFCYTHIPVDFFELVIWKFLKKINFI